LVGAHRLRETLYLDGAEVAALKEAALEATRRGADDDGVGFRQCLQASGEVRRLTYDASLPRLAGADEIAHDHQPRANADADLKRFGGLKLADSRNERQPRSRRSLGVVFVRLRIAEIDEDAITHALRDKAVEPKSCWMTFRANRAIAASCRRGANGGRHEGVPAGTGPEARRCRMAEQGIVMADKTPRVSSFYRANPFG
jgi:hypothetical protein